MNLVPVYFDKTSGEFVVKGDDSATAGGTFGHSHEQIAPSAVWVINHGKNTRKFVPQVFNDQYEAIVPNSVRVIDINTIEIDFAMPQTGFANLIMFR